MNDTSQLYFPSGPELLTAMTIITLLIIVIVAKPRV